MPGVELVCFVVIFGNCLIQGSKLLIEVFKLLKGCRNLLIRVCYQRFAGSKEDILTLNVVCAYFASVISNSFLYSG